MFKSVGLQVYQKNLFQFQNIYILSNGFPHLFGATFLLKMTETADLQNVSFMSLDESFLPNQNNWRVDGEFLI
jgi:hypothetical protein